MIVLPFKMFIGQANFKLRGKDYLLNEVSHTFVSMMPSMMLPKLQTMLQDGCDECTSAKAGYRL
jgi:hypothetical protein